ncbi:hypothetical protein MKX01_008786 [Papaver californicum]|nr:hypothetical protein MKX01_008786 [Papaver californicum]
MGIASALGWDNGVRKRATDIAGPKLVAAVANAGGLGLLASLVNMYDATLKAIRDTKKLTSKPFGAGILAIFEEKLACMQVFWGDYPKELVDEAHKNGVKILHQVGSVVDAEKAIAAGVDCIIAQGVEAWGHVIGTVSLNALLPRFVDLVGGRNITVVAAGAIADPRGFISALALGAKGICMGTSRDSWRATTRVLNTPFHQKWKPAPDGVENNEDQPIIGYSIIYGGGTVLRRFTGQVANQTTDGEVENMVMYAGQGVGHMTDTLPAGDIIIKELGSKFEIPADGVAAISFA